MKQYLSDNGCTLYEGDALRVLGELPSGSVHCVVTSPPYWGLRDYRCDGQLGLEKTPQEYVAAMVAVFAEARRVLRPDGTLWLNLGDCYATGAGKVGDCPGGGEQGERWSGSRGIHSTENSGKAAPRIAAMGPMTQPNRMPIAGLKPKDLCGMPWRVAFALQADGWYLRSEIIWSKPNPMPESVTDRPTKAHEQIFLLSKSERYFFDQEAVRENVTGGAHARGNGVNPKSREGIPGREKQNASWSETVTETVSSRNIRSVWTFATDSYKGAHFATFPRELVRRCVRAGTSEHGVCAACGAPWERVVEKSGGTTGKSWHNHKDDSARGHRGGDNGNVAADAYRRGDYQVKTLGWQLSCKCDAAIVPATVLDPFAGTCTVGVVCRKEGCRFIGIELNPAYCALAAKRLRERSLLVG